MINKERFSEVPHYELIQENEIIHIPSVFMFKGGHIELFSFLAACREMNCTVVFDNEEITIGLKDEILQDFVLSIYAHIAESPKIANDYMRYLANLDKMNWVKGVHEPILTEKVVQDLQ